MGSSIYNPCLPPTRQAEAVPDTSLHGRGIVTLGLRVPLLHEENLSFLKDISFYSVSFLLGAGTVGLTAVLGPGVRAPVCTLPRSCASCPPHHLPSL